MAVKAPGRTEKLTEGRPLKMGIGSRLKVKQVILRAPKKLKYCISREACDEWTEFSSYAISLDALLCLFYS